MAKNMKPVKVTSGSDLMRLVDEAATNSPVLLERHGVIYRLSKVAESLDVDDEPDAEAVRQNLTETVGSWADLDTDKLIDDMYEARRAGTRPLGRA